MTTTNLQQNCGIWTPRIQDKFSPEASIFLPPPKQHSHVLNPSFGLKLVPAFTQQVVPATWCLIATALRVKASSATLRNDMKNEVVQTDGDSESQYDPCGSCHFSIYRCFPSEKSLATGCLSERSFTLSMLWITMAPVNCCEISKWAHVKTPAAVMNFNTSKPLQKRSLLSKVKVQNIKQKHELELLSGIWRLENVWCNIKCQTFTSKYKAIFSETFEPLCSASIWTLYVEPFNLDVEPWSKTFMRNLYAEPLCEAWIQNLHDNFFCEMFMGTLGNLNF